MCKTAKIYLFESATLKNFNEPPGIWNEKELEFCRQDIYPVIHARNMKSFLDIVFSRALHSQSYTKRLVNSVVSIFLIVIVEKFIF